MQLLRLLGRFSLLHIYAYMQESSHRSCITGLCRLHFVEWPHGQPGSAASQILGSGSTTPASEGYFMTRQSVRYAGRAYWTFRAPWHQRHQCSRCSTSHTCNIHSPLQSTRLCRARGYSA